LVLFESVSPGLRQSRRFGTPGQGHGDCADHRPAASTSAPDLSNRDLGWQQAPRAGQKV